MWSGKSHRKELQTPPPPPKSTPLIPVELERLQDKTLQEESKRINLTLEGRLRRRAASLLTGHFNSGRVRPLDLCSSPGKRRAINSQRTAGISVKKQRLSITDKAAARGVPSSLPNAEAHSGSTGAFAARRDQRERLRRSGFSRQRFFFFFVKSIVTGASDSWSSDEDRNRAVCPPVCLYSSAHPSQEDALLLLYNRTRTVLAE